MATFISAVVLASGTSDLPPPTIYSLPQIKYETALSTDLSFAYAEDPLPIAPVHPVPVETDPPNPSILDQFEDKHGTDGGQCVTFIQRHFESFYSDPDFRGYAGDIVPNSQEPEVGAVVLTLESNGIGHAAIIGEIDYSSTTPELILVGSNYEGDETIQVAKRRMFVNDWRIRGYFKFDES